MAALFAGQCRLPLLFAVWGLALFDAVTYLYTAFHLVPDWLSPAMLLNNSLLIFLLSPLSPLSPLLPSYTLQVVPHGVAARAGLEKGDVILRMNSVSFEGCTHEQAVGHLKVRPI